MTAGNGAPPSMYGGGQRRPTAAHGGHIHHPPFPRFIVLQAQCDVFAIETHERMTVGSEAAVQSMFAQLPGFKRFCYAENEVWVKRHMLADHCR